jgi:endogenous inhibitor of DNA gyrase (YacG/DUF329 family)
MSDESFKVPVASGCPICGKAVIEKYKPFCSKRCADIDLHRWFSGAYAVPAEEEPDEDPLNYAQDA